MLVAAEWMFHAWKAGSYCQNLYSAEWLWLMAVSDCPAFVKNFTGHSKVGNQFEVSRHLKVGTRQVCSDSECSAR